MSASVTWGKKENKPGGAFLSLLFVLEEKIPEKIDAATRGGSVQTKSPSPQFYQHSTGTKAASRFTLNLLAYSEGHTA